MVTYSKIKWGSLAGTVYRGYLPGPTVNNESYKAPTTSGGSPGGWRYPTNYSRCVASVQSLSCFKEKTSSWYSDEYVEAQSGFYDVSVGSNGIFDSAGRFSVSSSVVERALTEALGKIPDQKINLAVAMAESGKAVDWLAQKASQLIYAYRHLRKGQFRKLYDQLVEYRKRSRNKRKWKKLPPLAKDYSGASSGWWLQYWYAFMPLVYDVHGAAQQVEAGFREKDQLFSVERTVTQPRSTPNPLTFAKHIRDERATWTSGKCTESCRVKLWGRVAQDQVVVLNQLGFANPALIAWELVPFSFVVDWVLPIGKYLGGLTATLGVNFASGHSTQVVRGEWEAYMGAPLPGSNIALYYSHWQFVSPGRCKMTVYAMKRNRLLSWPSSSIFIKSPWSTKNVITAIALITQLRK